MNPIVFALRRPITVMMLVLALALGGLYSIVRMQKDIFPSLNQPVLYVIHNYGGMDPKQIEGLITNHYELFFQYINGVEHVESRSIQSMVMLKLYFQPGTDMAEATAQTVAYCNRALSVMPPGRCRRTWSGSTRAACRSATSSSRARRARSASSRTWRCSGSGRCSPAWRASRRRPPSAATSGRSSSTSTPTGSAPTTSRPRTSSTRSTAATSSARPAT